MSYLRDRVIVLKNEPFREHDSWLTFYGQQHGKLIAVARGARRWEAKQLGHLEPLSEAEVMIAQGQAFDKVAVATTVSVRHQLRSRLSSLVIAGTMSSLVERLTHPGVADQTVYHLLIDLFHFLDQLPAEPSPERSRLFTASMTLHLLDTLGYALQLEQCIACQRTLSEPVSFVPEAGGMLCEVCMIEKRRQFPQAMRLPEQTIKLLRFIRQSDLSTLARLTVSTQLLQAASMVVDVCAEHHAPFLSKRPSDHDPIHLLYV